MTFSVTVAHPEAGALAPAAPAGSPAAKSPFFRLLALYLVPLFLFLATPVAPLYAAESASAVASALKDEAGRLAGEGKLFVQSPVDPYLGETAIGAGIFALTYLFDTEIRDEFAGTHHGVTRGITDLGNAASNPLLHLGVAAAFYGAGAAMADPQVMGLGEEMGEALLLADGATYLLKGAIGRGRPYQTGDNSSYRPLQFKDGYDSLPSMHTASSFALAHVVASKSPSLPAKVACYAAAALVGFSRVYQGKHWASDVVLGAGIGELAGSAVTRYRASSGGLAVAPLAIDGAPAVALIGKF